MNKLAFWIVMTVLAAALTACGVPVVRQEPATVYGPTAIAVEEEGAPPAEYVVEGETPYYYDVEPGVPYFPVFFGYPGSCFCYLPVRYFGGVWYGPGRVEVYRGHLPFYRGGPAHLNAWHEGHGTFRGHVAERGHMERGPAGRMHSVPPPGMHARSGPGPIRPAFQQHQGPVPQAHTGATVHPVPNIGHPTVHQLPQVQTHRPAMQQRPQMQRSAPMQRAPARAPARTQKKK